MAIEIERKFLVKGDFPKLESAHMIQGYLSRDSECTVRVRTFGDKAVLTIKGKVVGLCRPEFEYEIKPEDAQEMLKLCADHLIKKTRYYCPSGQHVWEVDVFHGRNTGLVMAEIELSSEDESFEKPDWVGEEVSGDPRYYNGQLSETPYTQW